MSSNRRKKTDSQIKKNHTLFDILSSQSDFEGVQELKKLDNIEIIAFKSKGINLILEKHVVEKIKLLRLTNSFNPKSLAINNSMDNLVSIANEFNRRSIGVKSAIVEENGIKFIIFSIEEIAIDEKMLNLSGDSLKLIAGILSGAPSLFEKLGNEKK